MTDTKYWKFIESAIMTKINLHGQTPFDEIWFKLYAKDEELGILKKIQQDLRILRETPIYQARISFVLGNFDEITEKTF
ncbi:MAG: hypothetical protein NPIRA04_12550 [Nitrospirales bacterium]|nr:MAG: hypothetical protein NPIRA04_12550 [Nitrospirales bacterium]